MAEKSCAELVQMVWPRVVFVKTAKRITKENFKSDFWGSVIYDADLPRERFPENPVFFPLCVEQYPRVLRSMSASQAGLWAMEKCTSVGWRMDEENVRCCLAQLNMDM